MAERLQHNTGSFWQHMLPTAAPGKTMQAGEIPLAPLSKVQAEWLALTQRWLEGFNSGTGASPH